jgi:uncharacterized coiled-coil DUF342 family protein
MNEEETNDKTVETPKEEPSPGIKEASEEVRSSEPAKVEEAPPSPIEADSKKENGKDSPREENEISKEDGKAEGSKGKEEADEGAEVTDVKEETAPLEAVEAKEPPIQDPLKGFELLSRKEIVNLLVEKHSDLRQKYSDELNGIDVKPPEVVKEKDEEKDIRDSINQKVQELKGQRKELKDKNKELRSEFFELLGKEEKLKGHKKEVSMYSQFSKDLEWKLETEAITIETERRLLDELRETMDKMRSITDGLTPQEIHSRLNEIQEEMGSNLMQIEDYHRQMMEKVEESNLHHDKFVDAKKQIRERESRRGWLKRRIELHKEMQKFWERQIEQAEKLDLEEGARDLEAVKSSLVDIFNERDTSKDQKEEEEVKDEKQAKKRKKEKKDGPKIGEEKKKEKKEIKEASPQADAPKEDKRSEEGKGSDKPSKENPEKDGGDA